ncbi:MAG: tight adherence protein, partial [Myxococcales bacterium]|nr:tight adherence protein [Myxococcales bacterium]
MNLNLALDQPVVAWTGMALIVAGVGTTGALICIRDSFLRQWWRNYMAMLERKKRALYFDLTPQQIPLLQLLGLVAGLAGGRYYDVKMYLLAPAALFAPRVAFIILTKQRREAIEQQIVPWLTVLINTLKVTGSLADALRQSLELTQGPLGQELDLTLKEIKMGLPLPETLRSMSQRIGSEIFATVVTVIIIGRSTGGALPEILGRTAGALRERFRLEGVLRKQTANAKMQLIVLLCSPIGVVLLFRVMDKKFFDPIVNGGLIGYGIIGVLL